MCLRRSPKDMSLSITGGGVSQHDDSIAHRCAAGHMSRTGGGLRASVAMGHAQGRTSQAQLRHLQLRHIGNGSYLFALGSARGAKHIPRAPGRRSRAEKEGEGGGCSVV